jgi:fructose/tagatose bisphosphate aldolase
MELEEILQPLVKPLSDSIAVSKGPNIEVRDAKTLRQSIESLVRQAVLAPEPYGSLARWLVRECAIKVGVVPASIHDLYLARGRGEARNDFTVPALNLRSLPFHAARAAFRACRDLDATALIFEIARSEIGYTNQRPAEYAACVLGAALAEGYTGPVFLQGDHFQTSPKRYAEDAAGELEAVRALSEEAIKAGFFNIDIDTSTLVDLERPTILQQQEANYTHCAELTSQIRSLQPEGVDVSVGGEIGEVGGHNSTEPELRAFMEGFDQTLDDLAPGQPGLSKISIQTGTSHGGVVLPDGSIAKVKVDFVTLQNLSRVARESFGMAGAVQHGASTLPLEAFPRFPESGACEVHLATNFQNILFDHLPHDFRQEMYLYLDQHFPHERKPDQTDEQFYYKTRKRSLGPFKAQIWDMPQETVHQVEAAWEEQFRILFERLNIQGTQAEVERHITPPPIFVDVSDYLKGVDLDEDVGDLAD